MHWVLLFFLVSNNQLLSVKPYTQYVTWRECNNDGLLLTRGLDGDPKWRYECHALKWPRRAK